MDDGSEARPLAQAGYAVTGSGGGGAGGRFVFADLDEVDAIVTEAEMYLDEIRDDGRALRRAAGLIVPPSENIMSVMEAKATVNSLEQAAQHNRALRDYVEAELAKLKACRADYVQCDEESAARLRCAGER